MTLKNDLIKILPEDIINSQSCIKDGEKVMENILEKTMPHGVIIEIGTMYGTSAILLSKYAKKVYTIDIHDGNGYPKKLLESLNINNIELIVNNSKENIKNIIEKIRKKEDNITLCFVDGNHEGDAPYNDLLAVSFCKYILCHDANHPPVNKSINKFIKEYNYDVDYFNDTKCENMFSLLIKKE